MFEQTNKLINVNKREYVNYKGHKTTSRKSRKKSFNKLLNAK